MAVSLGAIGTSDGKTYETDYDLHTGNDLQSQKEDKAAGQKDQQVAGDLPGRWKDEIPNAPVIDYDHERLQSLKSNQKKFLEDGHLGIQDKGEYFRMRLPEPPKRSAQLSDAGYNDIMSDAPSPVHDALRTLREHFVPTPNKDEPIQNQLLGALGTALLGMPAGPGPKGVPNPRQGFTDEFNTQTSRTQAAIDRLKTEPAPFSNRSESQQDGTSMGQMIQAVQRPFPNDYIGEWMQPGSTGIVGKAGIKSEASSSVWPKPTPSAANDNAPMNQKVLQQQKTLETMSDAEFKYETARIEQRFLENGGQTEAQLAAREAKLKRDHLKLTEKPEKTLFDKLMNKEISDADAAKEVVRRYTTLREQTRKERYQALKKDPKADVSKLDESLSFYDERLADYKSKK